MTARTHADLAADLLAAVSSHVSSHGEEMLAKHEASASLLVRWLGYLRTSQATGTADELLDGLHAGLIEAAGCLAVGLVRPAIFALRAQVDMAFAWLYFKNHDIEWALVERSGQKYRLVAEVEKYLRTFYARFEGRLKLLRSKRTCGDTDPYACLSAHVHGQNSSTIPPLVHLPELVQPKARCDECIALQREIAEYLNDVLTACFADQWADLPTVVRSGINKRLNSADLKQLCAR